MKRNTEEFYRTLDSIKEEFSTNVRPSDFDDTSVENFVRSVIEWRRKDFHRKLKRAEQIAAEFWPDEPFDYNWFMCKLGVLNSNLFDTVLNTSLRIANQTSEAAEVVRKNFKIIFGLFVESEFLGAFYGDVRDLRNLIVKSDNKSISINIDTMTVEELDKIFEYVDIDTYELSATYNHIDIFVENFSTCILYTDAEALHKDTNEKIAYDIESFSAREKARLVDLCVVEAVPARFTLKKLLNEDAVVQTESFENLTNILTSKVFNLSNLNKKKHAR